MGYVGIVQQPAPALCYLLCPPFHFATLPLQKGESIMVEVAKGGNTQEQLPMVLRVPHFNNEALSVCFGQFSLLGFGDILVPGLLVAYCHGFDLLTTRSRLYFISGTLFYGIGLVLTFVALYMMRTPQPALLYLVPATLLPTVCIAWCRGQLADIWHGVKPIPMAAQSNLQIAAATTTTLPASSAPPSAPSSPALQVAPINSSPRATPPRSVTPPPVAVSPQPGAGAAAPLPIVQTKRTPPGSPSSVRDSPRSRAATMATPPPVQKSAGRSARLGGTPEASTPLLHAVQYAQPQGQYWVGAQDHFGSAAAPPHTTAQR